VEHRSVKKAGIEVPEIKGWSESSLNCETKSYLVGLFWALDCRLKIIKLKIYNVVSRCSLLFAELLSLHAATSLYVEGNSSKGL
jgi:hypothetical protein